MLQNLKFLFMKKTMTSFIMTAALLILFVSALTDPLPENFTSLLDRAGMTFTRPDSLVEVALVKNSQMLYEYAMASSDRHFEVRYAIRPLDSMLAQYRRDTAQKQPGSYHANPNGMHAALFLAVLANISGRGIPKSLRTFDSTAVKNEFGADWGAVTGVPVSGDFGKGYRFCSAVAIHRNNAGDAYCFYLADSTLNLQEFSERMKPLFYALQFKQ